VHEIWSLFYGYTLEDRPCYSPEDVFLTFPFPAFWRENDRLNLVGKQYYDFRAAIMNERSEGLTRTYNRFHSPRETDVRIAELRRLHDELDLAVLEAYGWRDIWGAATFISESDGDSVEDAASGKLVWPTTRRDTVLARLSELNGEKSQQEANADDLHDI
jgi:hypothetical protein